MTVIWDCFLVCGGPDLPGLQDFSAKRKPLAVTENNCTVVYTAVQYTAVQHTSTNFYRVAQYTAVHIQQQ